MKSYLPALLLFISAHFFYCHSLAQQYSKGSLLYANTLSNKDSVDNWVMEGQGSLKFKDGWMKMYSPGQSGHHVLWCPADLTENFIAEWDTQNLDTSAGLCIVFFAAKGLHGEDIFSGSLPKRNGSFKGYINGAINNYHISYYANAKNEPDREFANLRKNRGFKRVQKGKSGIPLNSTATHKVQLIKNSGRIIMFIDERKLLTGRMMAKNTGPF